MSNRSTSTASITIPVQIDQTEKNVSKEIGQDPASAPDPFQVFLEPTEHPQNLSSFRKWLAVIVISSSALCATSASSIVRNSLAFCDQLASSAQASFTEIAVAEEFHVSHVVTILSISLFVEGLGVGPLLVGPLSEVYGRNIVYQVSYTLFFAFSWPVAFAPNIAVYLIFRFITGLCGSAFLSVAGGSVSDLFSDATVASPMALYTISPFIGPVLGPLISGFINQVREGPFSTLGARLTITIAHSEFVLALDISRSTDVDIRSIFGPISETYVPVLRKRKAERLRKSTGELRYYAPLEKSDRSLFMAILVSCYKPFQLILFDQMALLLDVWSALILGILYLTFQAFPIIFESGHGFNMQSAGLTFLGIGFGMMLAISTQPLWNRHFLRQRQKFEGSPPPETRLIMGQVGAILVPVGKTLILFDAQYHANNTDGYI
ncbi:hypothetical protein CCMSSC00406_0008596 [Pleurotus cornucopiae]|uniref:Uncharacterized protein n=1 Tax=Pleurotus cornucopiae TaxID=5321 RepID=A0ACB7IG56_PLECO|nr:hypothetical protein CCMSSC00406_0008596 [Pleurotus cornucopiae]